MKTKFFKIVGQTIFFVEQEGKGLCLLCKEKVTTIYNFLNLKFFVRPYKFAFSVSAAPKLDSPVLESSRI